MQDKEPIRIQVVIPFHQPLTTSDADLAEACKKCYVPILDAIEQAEDLRVSLHFNGHILDYLARKQEDMLLRLKTLTKRGQVEVLGGLFYGGIPALLPEMDVRGQIEMSGEFWDSYLGMVPRGLWLSELAWTPELPRLLEETGMDYSFIASGQLQMKEGTQRSLGCVERGGQSMAAFVLDSVLSGHLPGRPVDEWVKGAVDRGSKNGHRLLSVWVRAESLGLEPGSAEHCLGQDGWLSQWFAALSEANGLEPVLPEGTFPQVRPVEPLRLRNSVAPELHGLGTGDAVVDWTDFPFEFTEVDTLYRRMLRASEKLREAIGIMEDEELEETWSDKLATAQRLVFGAQAPDAYWRGVAPGFGDPAVRDATMARLQRAESMIDMLVQGDEDWLSTEDQDLDGDLSDEVFVATRHLMAWLVPSHGADIRSLDNRASERNVFDVGSRRQEPYFSAMAKAPKGKPQSAPGKRGENLVRLTDDLPTDADALPRRGMRHWILEQDTSPQEFFSGSAIDLPAARAPWDVMNNGIDEDGDCSYSLSISSQLPLQGHKARTLHVQKDLNIPIDSATVQQDFKLRLEGGSAVLWAMEIPVRLGLGAMKVLADGDEAPANKPLLSGVKSLRLESQDGEAMEIAFSASTDVWWLPVRSTLRALEGYQAVDQGVVVVPVVRVEGETSVGMTMRLLARSL